MSSEFKKKFPWYSKSTDIDTNVNFMWKVVYIEWLFGVHPLSSDVTRMRRATRGDNIDTFRCNFIFGPSWMQDSPVVIGFRPRRRASIVHRIKRAPSSLLPFPYPRCTYRGRSTFNVRPSRHESEAGREQSQASRNEHSWLAHKGGSKWIQSERIVYDDRSSTSIVVHGMSHVSIYCRKCERRDCQGKIIAWPSF